MFFGKDGLFLVLEGVVQVIDLFGDLWMQRQESSVSGKIPARLSRCSARGWLREPSSMDSSEFLLRICLVPKDETQLSGGPVIRKGTVSGIW